MISPGSEATSPHTVNLNPMTMAGHGVLPDVACLPVCILLYKP